MPKYLVIVESPAKAGTIGKYLGSDYIVKSSIGHIRDLPQAGSGEKSAGDATNALVRRMGIDPDKNWEATYAVIKGKEQVVGELKKIAKSVDGVFLATDKDREGEGIAYHVYDFLKEHNVQGNIHRITFNEITKKAIQESHRLRKPTRA